MLEGVLIGSDDLSFLSLAQIGNISVCALVLYCTNKTNMGIYGMDSLRRFPDFQDVAVCAPSIFTQEALGSGSTYRSRASSKSPNVVHFVSTGFLKEARKYNSECFGKLEAPERRRLEGTQRLVTYKPVSE